MKLVATVVLVVLLGMPFLLFSSQQASKTKLPVAVSNQQSTLTKLPLAITDKLAVEEWSRTIYDGPADPKVPGDTAFLLSLNEKEMLGRFWFRQRCAVCHGAQADGAPTLGPILSRVNVAGLEDEVRQKIREGSSRMPGFRYTTEPETVDAIIAYLKKVPRSPGGPNQEIENTYLRIDRFRSVSARNRSMDLSNRTSVETASK